MTHFDAHKLAIGDQVADPDGRERDGKPVPVKVKNKWTDPSRRIIKCQLRGFGSRWFDATQLQRVPA